MSVQSTICFATFMWIVIYIFIYYVLYSTSPQDNSREKSSGALGVNKSPKILVEKLSVTMANTFPVTRDPFLSPICNNLIQGYNKLEGNYMATVIINVNYKEKWDTLQTIISVLENSGHYLKKIVVIDDSNVEKINDWKEWSTIFSNYKSFITIMRTSKTLKTAGAVHEVALQVLKDVPIGSKEIVVFLSPKSVVSDNWVASLFHTLSQHPKSVVYPGVDVLDTYKKRVVRGHNVLGGFDWGFSFKWEDALSTGRLFSGGGAVEEDTLASSPAAPPVAFALNAAYYKEIGGILPIVGDAGIESVELSLRVWLCGGSVLRQPCSRVAVKYPEFNSQTAVYRNVRKAEVDRAALTVAEVWLEPAFEEYVFMSRFTNSLPYKEVLPLDASSPKTLAHVPALVQDKCQSFGWYLDEVYPGLKKDIAGVQSEYVAFINSGYQETLLQPILDQYKQEQSHVTYIDSEVQKLSQHAHRTSEVIVGDEHKKLEPPQPASLRKKTPQEIEDEEHVIHAEKVRENFLCEDEILLGKSLCPVKAGTDKSGCTDPTMKSYMIFGCPKTCDMCGADGKICVDFFEKKCPEWKAQGMCESSSLDMRKKCRVSCGACTRANNGIEHKVNSVIANLVDKQQQQFEAHTAPQTHPPVPDIPLPPAPSASVNGGDLLSQFLGPTAADPYVAQKKYAAGELPDPHSDKPCEAANRGDASLLDRIKVSRKHDANPNNLRIFCGVYTMESNHATNVKATIQTWGKKCTGFLAFSTATDPTYPTIRIEHEGDEAYDNMWQKSRSIWKYIAEHYIDQFDYFLMGGDDMFYIIENYLHYLNSDEIQNKKREGKGQFIGRRFFPPKQEVFNSGGAGYTLDRAALKVLKDNIDTPKCFPHQRGFWEDVNVANCLRVSAKILPYDTRDELQRERFHPFTPANHVAYRIPKNPDWYAKYNPELKIGFDCCSAASISFHYCPAAIMTGLHTYLYQCQKPGKLK